MAIFKAGLRQHTRRWRTCHHHITHDEYGLKSSSRGSRWKGVWVCLLGAASSAFGDLPFLFHLQSIGGMTVNNYLEAHVNRSDQRQPGDPMLIKLSSLKQNPWRSCKVCSAATTLHGLCSAFIPPLLKPRCDFLMNKMPIWLHVHVYCIWSIRLFSWGPRPWPSPLANVYTQSVHVLDKHMPVGILNGSLSCYCHQSGWLESCQMLKFV